jgi:multiple sugar transport system substrate-binding protein
MQSKIRQKLCLFLGPVAVLLSSSLWGCGHPPQPEVDSARASGEESLLKVACPGEPITSVMKRYAPTWARNAQARVETVIYQDAAELPNLADVSAWVIRPAELPRWAAERKLMAVPAEYKAAGGAYGWNGLLPLYREKLLKWAGEVYGLPVLGEAPLCIYRADLLADSKHQQAFQDRYHHPLGPPKTWEEFADVSEYFCGSRDPRKTAPSLPPLPENSEELDYVFQAVAAPYARQAISQDTNRAVGDDELFSYHYDLKTGQPRIDHPGFVRALQLLQKLQRFRPSRPDALPAQAFAEGSAVLCLAEASWIARFRKRLPENCIGVCEVPGSASWFRFQDGKEQSALPAGNHVPYLGAGGWIAVVPRSAPQAKAAFALFADLGGRNTSSQIISEPQWGGGIFREEHFKANWLAFELDHAMTVQLPQVLRQTVARPGLKNPVVRLRIPDQGPYQQILVEQVRKAIFQNSDAKQALANVAQAWRKLDEGKDEARRRDDYLLSLGLAPLQESVR